MLSNLGHGTRKLVVRFAAERVELLGDIECDNGEFAAVFGLDGFFGHDDNRIHSSLCV